MKEATFNTTDLTANEITADSISSTTPITRSEMDIRKIEAATEGLTPRSFNLLSRRVLPQNRENAITICDYVNSMRHEVNLSVGYREDLIVLLGRFSIFFSNGSKFKEITRENILSFLDSYRRSEASDPLHKWIGTYNLFRVHLMRFFRWLYYPDINPSRTRPKPAVIENIPQLKRKEKSIYKPTDLWTDEDDSLFLKYCPNARDRCHHAMARDSAARPHELLKLRIKDVVFKLTPDKKQYAEVLVNGKTGTRSIPLINSIPYIKDWISQHPQGGNPNRILLCGFGKSMGRQIGGVGDIYSHYKKDYFPKLLDNPNVLPEDKQKIRELLKKPWNPYIRRHSALTEKSGILKEHYLRQFAGWSPGSNMHLKYLHYFGNESNDSILEAYGIISKDKNQLSVLRPKSCPNCDEPNKPDSKFCARCKMVLTYDAYNETVEQKQEKDKQIEVLMEKQERFEQMLQSLIDSGQLKPALTKSSQA